MVCKMAIGKEVTQLLNMYEDDILPVLIRLSEYSWLRLYEGYTAGHADYRLT